MDNLELELKLAEQHLERAQREFHAAQDQVSDLRNQLAQKRTEDMRANDVYSDWLFRTRKSDTSKEPTGELCICCDENGMCHRISACEHKEENE